MRLRIHATVVSAGLLLALGAPLHGQAATGPAIADSLLERLVGTWRMVGNVRGRPVEYRLTAARVLSKRFIELHMIDVAEPAQYEARVFIGTDTVPGRVLVHWLDGFGAAYSVPAGAGSVHGDTLQFEFRYSDGPFRDIFVFRGSATGWHFRLEAGDGRGGWRSFAEYAVTPVRPPAR